LPPLILLLVLLLAWLPRPACAEDNPLGLREARADGVRLFYADSLDYLVPYTVASAVRTRAWQRQRFSWMPDEPATFELLDDADLGSGSTLPAPRGLSTIESAALPIAQQRMATVERVDGLVDRESMQQMKADLAAPDDLRWRRYFLGKVAADAQNPESLGYALLTTPGDAAPRWLRDGAAAFLQTWMGGVPGRAQSGPEEMVLRTLVRDGAPFPTPLELEGAAARGDPVHGVPPAVYGRRFVAWLALTRSPAKVLDAYRRDAASARGWSDRFEQVFDLPFLQAWQEWSEFERGFQEKQLSALGGARRDAARNDAALPAMVSHTALDEASGTLYAAVALPGEVPALAALDLASGRWRSLVPLGTPPAVEDVALALDTATGTLFYSDPHGGWRDLMALDLRSGTRRLLIRGARVGALAFDPQDGALLGIRQESGLSTLVRIPRPYDTWYRVQNFDYGVLPAALAVSPDGRYLAASVTRADGEQVLRVWDKIFFFAGQLAPLSECRFGAALPEDFAFSPDGRFLYGSSFHTGVSNVLRYETLSADVQLVSRAQSGWFHPHALADGRLLVLEYTAAGFRPLRVAVEPQAQVPETAALDAMLLAAHPQIAEWLVPAPTLDDVAAPLEDRGPYVPCEQAQLSNALPVLQGYKRKTGLGYRLRFDDPLQFASLSVTGAYTPAPTLPGGQRGHLDFAARYELWRGELDWNRSDFYDIFGPVERSLKGYTARLGWDRALLYDSPNLLTLSLDAAEYAHIDTLPGAQNVATTFTQLATAEAGLRYSALRRPMGAVDDTQGWRWELDAKAAQVPGEFSVQPRGGIDVGVALGGASAWLLSAAGAAGGHRASPAGTYFFGGFGNNVVDDKALLRFQQFDSFPGFGIDAISGSSFVREMLQGTLAPWELDGGGFPALSANWLRTSVFAGALWTNPDDPGSRADRETLGWQADLRLRALHVYDLTLSAGYALGLQGGHRAGQEWMISLKIL
jgi:hypothetical protein